MKLSPKKSMNMLAITALCLELTACGGGGSTSAPTTSATVQVTQAQASDVALTINGGDFSTLIALLPGEDAIGAMLTLGAGSNTVSSNCASAGTVPYQYTKTSAAGSIAAGDAVSMTYAGCSDGTVMQDGQFTYTVASASSSMVSGIVAANNFSATFAAGESGAVSGTYTYGLTANSSTVATETLTGSYSATMAGFGSSAAVKNQNYAVNDLSFSQLTASTSTGKSYTKSIAFNLPYVGLDGGSYTLAVTQTSPLVESYTNATSILDVSTPGLYEVTGYQGATIFMTNTGTELLNVRVQNGSAGAPSLEFNLSGAYMLKERSLASMAAPSLR